MKSKADMTKQRNWKRTWPIKQCMILYSTQYTIHQTCYAMRFHRATHIITTPFLGYFSYSKCSHKYHYFQYDILLFNFTTNCCTTTTYYNYRWWWWWYFSPLHMVPYPIPSHPIHDPRPPAYLEPEEEEVLSPSEVMVSLRLVDLPFILGTDTATKGQEGRKEDGLD